MKIAVFTKNRLNPAYDAARLGAERSAAQLGAVAVHYVPRVPDDAGEQCALIRRAIDEGADAIALSAVHPTRVNAAVAEINAAGLPLAGFISRTTEGKWDTFVGSDDVELGRSLAQYLFARMAGKGDVVIVEASADSTTSLDRARGFRDAAAEYPGIRIAGCCHGAYQYAAAQMAMAQLLERTPRVDAVLAANDVMALGAIDALRAVNRKAIVVGINAIPEAVAAVKSGALLATANFNAMNLAALAVEALVRRLRGETVPPSIMLPTAIVDSSNVNDWDLPFEQRPCVEWAAATAATPAKR
jgi:ribose transport system substrate-binding protein